MKKVLALLLAMVLVLSLAACGGGSSGDDKTEPKEETLKVGDTAEGKISNVTVDSVDFVDKIEGGLKRTAYHQINGIINHNDYYEDVTAEAGYSIVKITYSFDYTGKKEGNLQFGFVLDYDGYTFDGYGNHALPKEKAEDANAYLLSSWDEQSYVSKEKTSFTVTDPISYKGDKGEKYIIISDEVKKDTEKPYVLKVNVSLADDNNADNSQKESFVFDLR